MVWVGALVHESKELDFSQIQLLWRRLHLIVLLQKSSSQALTCSAKPSFFPRRWEEMAVIMPDWRSAHRWFPECRAAAALLLSSGLFIFRLPFSLPQQDGQGEFRDPSAKLQNLHQLGSGGGARGRSHSRERDVERREQFHERSRDRDKKERKRDHSGAERDPSNENKRRKDENGLNMGTKHSKSNSPTDSPKERDKDKSKSSKVSGNKEKIAGDFSKHEKGSSSSGKKDIHHEKEKEKKEKKDGARGKEEKKHHKSSSDKHR